MSSQSTISNHPGIILGISGASGAVYGMRILETLKALHIPSHLVISRAAAFTITQELSISVKDLEQLAHTTYHTKDIGAAIASGSCKTAGMIIAPCSIKTMSEIASGVTSSLLTRAADVCLKERRKLVLMVRETPFHTGHLRTMCALSEMGAIIAPPLPAFYQNPQTIDDIVNHSVGRVLDLFDINHNLVSRWAGLAGS